MRQEIFQSLDRGTSTPVPTTPLRRNCPMQNKANSGSAPMRLRLIECGSLVVLLLWAFAISAFSAEKPAAAALPAPAQKSAAAPVPIATTDVIPRSARALDQLREIREKLDTDNSVSVVEAGLPAFTQQLDEWWKVEAATIKQLRSVQRINDVLWQWRLYEDQVAAWNGLLATSSKEWSAEESVSGVKRCRTN